MKTGCTIILCVVLASCYRPSAQESFQDLQQLQGNWEARSGVIFNEAWEKVNDSLMSGFGYNLKQNDTLFLEELSLHISHDTVYYGALTPENKRYIFFKLVSASATEWVFENPDHDYPNIITYKIRKDSLLDVSTTNIRGNKKIEFLMVKSN